MCTWARRVFGTLHASNPQALLKCSLRRRGRRPCGSVTIPCDLSSKAFLVLGTPFGSEAFKKEALRNKALNHGRLLDRIPSLPDLQSGWLLLLLCAAPRCNYLLPSLAPSLTDEFARSHDEGVARCLADLLANDAPVRIDEIGSRRAALPLKLGGLGLRRAAEAVRGGDYPPCAVAQRWREAARSLAELATAAAQLQEPVRAAAVGQNC